MEKKNKRAVIVGAFVFAALVILVLGVMTLGGQNSVFNKGATIHAVFNEVNGLQAGNNVWYAGVKVGTVKHVSFTESGQVDVEMIINESSLPVIKKNTKAKLGADGFIGNKLVVLFGGTPSAPVVANGSTVQTEASLSPDEIMATLQENNKNILAITNNFKTISDKISNGEGSVGKLLNDETLYRDLENSMTSLRVATAQAQNLVANVSNYTSRLTAKGSLTNDLITDTVIFARLRNAVREVNTLTESAGQIVSNLATTSQTLQQKLNDPSSPAGVLLNDTEAAANLKATLQNLQTSTEKLDDNMEALQHNFLFRGFFRKKNNSQ